MRAHSHHSGPDVGWRSTIRRHATTSPDVSRPSPRQRARRLADQRLAVGPPRPGHVAQALDGVHALTVPTCGRAPRRSGRGELGGGASSLPARGARAARHRLLPSHPVATNPPMDLVLAPLGAEARPLEEWLTTFHLATVVLDPYTNESSWILPTAARILEGLRGSDARVNFLVTSDESDTRAFLGPLVEQFLVFTDPERMAVKALGLDRVAGVHLHPRRRHRGRRCRRVDGGVVARRRPHDRRGDGLAPARHPGRRRSRPVPRVAGARLTPCRPAPRCFPTFRSSRSWRRARRAGRTRPSRRCRPTRRRQDDGRAARPARGAVARDQRIVMLEPRRLATRAAARRMARPDGDGGRRAGRLPDPRRAAIGPATRDRGAHRRRADAATAAGPRLARRRGW